MNLKQGKTVQLLVSMLKIGLIGFGGGSALIPLMEEEAVDKRKFVMREEFEKDVVVASITPGALPVELAGGIGKRLLGWRGLALGAAAMALPGVVMTLLLLTVTFLASEGVMRQIEFFSVGITGYILSLLVRYVKGTAEQVEDTAGKVKCIGVMLLIFALTGVKNLYRIFHVTGITPLSLSTSQIFAIVFFFLFYLSGHRNGKKMLLSVLLVGGYILTAKGAPLEYVGVLHIGVRITMIGVSLYEMIKTIPSVRKGRRMANQQKGNELLLLLLMISAVFVLAVGVTGKSAEFIGKGFLSSLMSFGGGDAYLTVADGLFVNNQFLTEEVFYGYLVPVVNVLPGSILCKMLTGIGYYIGYSETHSILTGYIVALAGFVCSLAASCGVFAAVGSVYEVFQEIPAFVELKRWIRTVVSGLMLTVSSSLVYQSVRLGREMQYDNLIGVVFCILIVNGILHHNKSKSWKQITVSAVLSLTACNLLYM